MKSLSKKEEEIMHIFWDRGPMFVKELQELYDEPKPHINTLSTQVRMLEDKGFIGHKAYGKNCYQYYPIISKEEFQKRTLKGVINKYFNNSYLNFVSSLVKEEEISISDLKELIRQVEEANN